MATRPIAEPWSNATVGPVLEIALEVGRVPPHPHDHPRDHPDGDQRDDRLELLLLLLREVLLGDPESHRRTRAERHRQDDPEPHPPHRVAPALLDEEGGHDPHDERSLEALTEPDDEGGKHPRQGKARLTNVSRQAALLFPAGEPPELSRRASGRAARRSPGSRSTGSACRSATRAPRRRAGSGRAWWPPRRPTRRTAAGSSPTACELLGEPRGELRALHLRHPGDRGPGS